MEKNFDEQVRTSELYIFACKTGLIEKGKGTYHFRGGLRSPNGVKAVLNTIAEEVKKHKKILSEKQQAEYQKILEENTISKSNADNTKKGESKMTDKTSENYQDKLINSPTYLLAQDLKLLTGEYKITDKKSFNQALSEIKATIKKHQQKQTEEQNNKDLDNLKKDHPDWAKEYESILKEEKTDSKPENSITVDSKSEESPEDTSTDLSWIEEEKKFWEKYAKDNDLESDFTPPEGDTSKLYCKLSKDSEEKGVISYASKNNIQVSKDSDLTAYLGIAERAVQSNRSITFGKSLDQKQQLMLYAAILLSNNGKKIEDQVQVVKWPELPANLAEILDTDEFKKLPKEAKDALLKQQQNLEQLKKARSIVAVKQQLDPEQNKGKLENRDQRIAALMGIRTEKTTYNTDIKDKDGKVIHHKGDAIEKDESLFNKDGKLNDASHQEVYDLLMKRQEAKGK